MQRYPRPGDALHVGHGSSAINIRAVPSLFADHAEYAKRRRMTRNSRGHRRACHQRPIVIKRDPLVCDRDDDLERALRSVPGLSFLRQFRFWMPVVVLVPERSVIAPPRPVLRPKRKLGVCGPHRKYENGKGCHDRRADESLSLLRAGLTMSVRGVASR